MARFARWGIALLLLATWWVAVLTVVAEPFRQLLDLKYVVWRTDYTSVASGASRDSLRRLESPRTWDPYLTGPRDLYLARNYRRLGRPEEAVAAYERAISGRVPASVLVEAGVYDLEIGRQEQGEAKLLMAAAYSGRLLDAIDDPGWRKYIQEKLYEEGLAERISRE